MDLLALFLVLAAVPKGTAATLSAPFEAAREAARRQLESARAECRRNPVVPVLDRLAAAEIREYRFTHAAESVAAASAAIGRALAADPRDFAARRMRASIRLTNHEFAAVERDCLELLAERPRDVEVLGMLADSRMEAGRYPEALESIQRLVDVRPGLPAYSRVSYAREIHGELEGALSAMDMALAAGDASDPEGLAWCLARSGLLAWKLGRVEDAGRRYREALALNPRCPYALEGLGQVAAARGDLEEAGRRFEEAFSVVPWPQFAIERYEIALRRADDGEISRWRSVVRALETLSSSAGLFNRALSGFEASYGDPARAVSMAAAELEGRKDVYGWDAYGWALYRAGRHAEAAEAETRATARDTQDPVLDYRAAEIFASAGLLDRAARHARRAVAENPRALLWPPDGPARLLHRLRAAAEAETGR